MNNNQNNEKESIMVWERFVSLFSIPNNINEILNNSNNNNNNSNDNNSNSNSNLKVLFESIKLYKLESLVFDWYYESINKYFKDILSREFWKFFNNVDLEIISTNNNSTTKISSKELKVINHQFALSINLLYKVFSYFKSNLLLFYKYLLNSDNELLDNSCNGGGGFSSNILIKKLQDLLITNLVYSNKKSKYFNTILFMFFERDFISFTKSFYNAKRSLKLNNSSGSKKDNDDSFQEDNEEEEEEEEENQDEVEGEVTEEPSYVMDISFEDSITDINIKEDSFMDLCKKLHDLNFIVISEEIFTQILFKKIFEHIEKRCKGIFEKRFLQSILDWADQVIFKWLGMILLSSSNNNSNNSSNSNKNILNESVNNGSIIINSSLNQSFKDFDDNINNNNSFINNNQDEELINYNNKIFNQWKTRLEFSIYENFSQQRISELFDMIVQYPDSLPSLEDLAVCFQKIPIEKQLINNLKRVLLQRLLHPGANTNDIITQYISTIHSMNIIDSSGYVMEQVGKPIREYLSQREDTIRCIVSSFTDESNTEIYEEFCNYDPDSIGDSLDFSNQNLDLYLDENDFMVDYKQWNPLSIDGNILKSNSGDGDISKIKSKSTKKDTISHLVNIYEGTDLFINEYRSMLSDRLLSINEFDLDKEIKNIELLKLRFGESGLYNCEIMIKDMSDSKRLNTQIKSILNNSPNNSNKFEFETLILSELFWPTLKGEEFSYPKSILNKMELFSKEYERIKAPRQLIWKQHLGLVDLEIETGNGQIQSFQVSPIHASLIVLFEDENQLWTLDQLAKELKASKDFIKKKLIFWINNQIIKEVSFEKYQVNQQQQQHHGNEKENQEEENEQDDDSSDSDSDEDKQVPLVEEEEEEKSTSAKEKEEQMRVVESFIIGMLINFKALPLERIHSLLTMFNSEQYTSTIQELKVFLLKLQNEDKIELVGNDYKIKK